MASRFNSIVDRVDAAYAHLVRRRGSELVARWYPNEAGSELEARVRQMSTVTTAADRASSDRAMRPVIKAFQAGDAAAGVVLLEALSPGLLRIAAHAPKYREGASLDDHLSAATLALAGIDPATDRLYGRILGRVRARTRRAPESSWRRAVVTDHVPEAALIAGSVDERALARLRLSELVAMVRAAADAGFISADDWRFFVAHRLARWPGAELGHTATDRSRARRIGERLQRVIRDCESAELCPSV
jgi:hypothetical protein